MQEFDRTTIYFRDELGRRWLDDDKSPVCRDLKALNHEGHEGHKGKEKLLFVLFVVPFFSEPFATPSNQSFYFTIVVNLG